MHDETTFDRILIAIERSREHFWGGLVRFASRRLARRGVDAEGYLVR